jgi:hypothetical protein
LISSIILCLTKEKNIASRKTQVYIMAEKLKPKYNLNNPIYNR